MHQIHLTRTGLESFNKCAAGCSVSELPTKWVGRTLRVSKVKIPALEIIEPTPSAVTRGASVYDMMDGIKSMGDLVNFFDGLLYNGTRFLYAFYSNNEFELCTTQAIALDVSLAALLKLPVNIAAGSCLSSHVDPTTFTPVWFGYSVQVTDGIRGMSTDVPGRLHNQTLAILDANANCDNTPSLFFETVPTSIFVEVFRVTPDMGLYELTVADTERFEITLDIT